MTFLHNLWHVIAESAPYLTLGLIAAAVLHQFIPASLINRFISGSPLVGSLKAAIIGTPVPLCSCGVVPLGLSLHREGAGRHSTVSFLIATPENGVDSISLSLSLFGGLFTLIRVVFAFIVAVICGVAVSFIEEDPVEHEEKDEQDCCHSADSTTKEVPSEKRNGLRFVVFDFLPEIIYWMLCGFIISALIATLVPADSLSKIDGTLSLFAAALIGLPLYVCASASTPIALSLFLSGMSPGACLVFLLTGPATNAANIPIYIKELGYKTTLTFYSVLFAASIFFGYLVNQVFDREDFATATFAESHNHAHNPLEWLGIALFFIASALAIYKKRQKKA